MVDMRDRKTRQVREGHGNAALFQDVAELNRTLGQNAETVRLFREIGKTDAALATQCWWFARDVVFAEKQYDLAKKYLPAPLKEYDLAKAQYDEQLPGTIFRRIGGAHFRQWLDNNFVKDCLQVIELATFSGDQAGGTRNPQACGERRR